MSAISQTKHTQGEIQARPDPHDHNPLGLVRWDLVQADESDPDDAWFIATCISFANGGTAEGNAKRLCLTWNCHDDLVTALREVAVLGHGKCTIGKPLADMVRAALAKVEARS